MSSSDKQVFTLKISVTNFADFDIKIKLLGESNFE